MIDKGDRFQRVVCDVCERPFDPKRVIPAPPVCRDCRADLAAADSTLPLDGSDA